MTEPLIEIVILNYNGHDVVDECVQSILDKTTYRNYLIIFADNGSIDDSLEKAEKKYTGNGKVIFVKIPNNTGYSRGMNIAIEDRLVKSNCKFFVLLNNDIVITDPDWLQNLLRPMMTNSSIGITCGALKTPSGKIQVGGMMQFNGLTMSYIGPVPLEKDGFLDFAQMAACLVRREVLVKTKGFDERYTPFSSEETDFSLRAKYLGYSIYFVHGLVLFHKHSVALNKVDPPYTQYIGKRNLIRFRLLHYPLHWIFFSLFLEYRVLFNMFFLRSGKGIKFNRNWSTHLKGYLVAILVNILQLGETLDRRMQLNTQKKH